MNIDTGEIKPIEQLTPTEKQSGRWMPVEKAAAIVRRHVDLVQRRRKRRARLARKSRRRNRH